MERRINGMKSNTQNPKNLNQLTGNTSKDIVQQSIDEETKYVIEYFNANNIPFHMENGIAIRDDLPDTIEMTCKRCKKKHDMPYDIYMEMLEYADPFEEMEFIVIECVYCHKGDMLPTKYLNKK